MLQEAYADIHNIAVNTYFQSLNDLDEIEANTAIHFPLDRLSFITLTRSMSSHLERIKKATLNGLLDLIYEFDMNLVNLFKEEDSLSEEHEGIHKTENYSAFVDKNHGFEMDEVATLLFDQADTNPDLNLGPSEFISSSPSSKNLEGFGDYEGDNEYDNIKMRKASSFYVSAYSSGK